MADTYVFTVSPADIGCIGAPDRRGPPLGVALANRPQQAQLVAMADPSAAVEALRRLDSDHREALLTELDEADLWIKHIPRSPRRIRPRRHAFQTSTQLERQRPRDSFRLLGAVALIGRCRAAVTLADVAETGHYHESRGGH
jgi:hypothetical protein